MYIYIYINVHVNDILVKSDQEPIGTPMNPSRRSFETGLES